MSFMQYSFQEFPELFWDFEICHFQQMLNVSNTVHFLSRVDHARHVLVASYASLVHRVALGASFAHEFGFHGHSSAFFLVSMLLHVNDCYHSLSTRIFSIFLIYQISYNLVMTNQKLKNVLILIVILNLTCAFVLLVELS